MNRLRVLVLAPDCNPESVTTPQIAYAHAEALARHHAVTLVVRAANEAPIRKAGGSFEAIHPIRLPGLDEFYSWALRRVFKYDYGRQSLTAATYPLQVAFEWSAWRQLSRRIRSGDFDVVLRILPIVTVLPSPFAYFLRNGPIPFVLGPLNGGLPWPEGFPSWIHSGGRPDMGFPVFAVVTGTCRSRVRPIRKLPPSSRAPRTPFPNSPPIGKSCSLFLEKTAWNPVCFNAAKAFAAAMNASFDSCLSAASFH